MKENLSAPLCLFSVMLHEMYKLVRELKGTQKEISFSLSIIRLQFVWEKSLLHLFFQL